MVDSKQLHGFSLEDAECFGKPHLGARYVSKDPERLGSYVRDFGTDRCSICFHAATNTHHQPYRQTFTLTSYNGMWKLRPALIALCGSGTTGCHGRIEHNEIKVRWKWDEERYQDQWWNGQLLREYGPHSIELYRFGCWEITMPDGNVIHRRIRREPHE